MKHIKTALIGFGYRGKQLLRLLRTIESYKIVGIADINGCGDSESPGASFYQGEEAYKMMLDEQQPNLVFITTPWHLHITHATECILRNCHVALEIKGGLCQDEYAPLQEIAQQKGVKVFPLENTLFMREILAVKRMVDEGALGEIIYMRGGYRHDLRKLLLDDNGVLGGRKGTESVWRSRFYSHHNADIYPTHGLGPLCMILGIGKTDHLAWLTSFATKAVGLRQHMSEDDTTPITLGDIISTQIETQGGTLISLTHDTTLPRPRSLDFEVQGSLGIWDGVNRRIYLEEKGELYSMPFNMYTFNKMWGVVTPEEAAAKIEEQKKEITGEPKNLEEQAISLVGRDIYEKLVKGYTEKQWGRDCKELPAFIIKRLPVRLTFDNNYFNALYQGIPIGGYTKMVENLLDGIEVRLNTDYLEHKAELDSLADKVVYTGPIDAYFGFKLGTLEYRSVRFENETLDIPNFQGNAAVNYTDRETPWTRIIEHKWFEFGKDEDGNDLPKTIISREYSSEWKAGDEPYYPVNDEKNGQLYAKYKELADKETGVIFGGRLGEYKYYDMDTTIASVLDMCDKELG